MRVYYIRYLARGFCTKVTDKEYASLPRCHTSFVAIIEVPSYLQILLTIATLSVSITTKKQSSSSTLKTLKLMQQVMACVWFELGFILTI